MRLGSSPLPQATPNPAAAAPAQAADARQFAATVVAAAPPRGPVAEEHHHRQQARARFQAMRRSARRSRRVMGGADDDAEIDTSAAEAESEQAAKADAAITGASPDGGRRDGGHGEQDHHAADHRAARPGQGASPAASFRPSPSGATAAAPLLRLVPGPVRAFAARLLPARLPPQTPAPLERNATAKLPLATRMGRATPHRDVVPLFAFKGRGIYDARKRLSGLLWWADWRAMRGFGRLPSREAPRGGRLRPVAPVPFVPRFGAAPRAAALNAFSPGRAVLQAWAERPVTAALSAFPVHCGEPYGLRAALAWQTREDDRRARLPGAGA